MVLINEIVSWSRKAFVKLRNCKSYELSGRIPVCSGMDNLSAVMLENPAAGTERFFDNGLFMAFIFGVISFLVASFFMIFCQDLKSLKNIRNKVARTTDTIVNLLRALWLLKICKRANIALEEEILKKNKREAQIETLNDYVPFEMPEGHDSILQESKYQEPTEYVEQIEFSLNDEWCPPKDEENVICLTETPADVPRDINFTNQDYSERNSIQTVKRQKHNSPSRLPKSKSDSTRSKYGSVEVLYERKSVLRESNGNRSKKRDNTSINGITTSHDFPSTNRHSTRISHMSYFAKKDKNSASDGESTTRGIFSQRRRSKYSEQIIKNAERKTPHAKFRSIPVE